MIPVRVGDLIHWRAKWNFRGYGTVARISGNTLSLICPVTSRMRQRARDGYSYKHSDTTSVHRSEVVRVVFPSRLISDGALR